jgi:hypothetical protein
VDQTSSNIAGILPVHEEVPLPVFGLTGSSNFEFT